MYKVIIRTVYCGHSGYGEGVFTGMDKSPKRAWAKAQGAAAGYTFKESYENVSCGTPVLQGVLFYRNSKLISEVWD